MQRHELGRLRRQVLLNEYFLLTEHALQRGLVLLQALLLKGLKEQQFVGIPQNSELGRPARTVSYCLDLSANTDTGNA